MELLLRRYFWIVNIGLVVGTGYALARAASSYVEHEVLTVPLVEEKQADEADTDEETGFMRPTMNRSVDLERRRALMKGPEKPATAETPVEAPVEEQMPEEAVEEAAVGGDLSLEYIAAITSSVPDNSLALVRVDGGETKWVGIGTELKPGFNVTTITNYYIGVSQGVTELLWKKKEAEPKVPALAGGRGAVPPGPRGKPEKPATAAQPPAAAAKTPYTEGVKQTGPFEYNIDRGMLNEQLNDLAKLGREARVIPNYDRDSSAYKGFKLIGVRPNSLYRAIGIRSGDVIMQINGEELNSPGKALELFTKLQNSSAITLDIMRRGQKQTLQYKIE